MRGTRSLRPGRKFISSRYISLFPKTDAVIPHKHLTSFPHFHLRTKTLVSTVYYIQSCLSKEMIKGFFTFPFHNTTSCVMLYKNRAILLKFANKRFAKLNYKKLK